MVINKGRNINTNDAPVHTSVSLNSSTWTEILDSNTNRVSIEIQNDNSQEVLLYFGATGDAVDADALKLYKKALYYSFTDNVDTSKISAKSVSGTPTLRIKES